MEPTRPIMVLGATGVFGSRVCRLLLMGGTEVVAVVRDADRLDVLVEELAPLGTMQTAPAILPEALPELLLEHHPLVVIDAVGPFQESDHGHARLCIEHGSAYLDLSDGRAHVASVGELDSLARKVGVPVLSGVSTLCALSSAVIANLGKSFTTIDTIVIAIAPGNDAPRGPAVTRAVLSWVGQPVPAWSHGRQVELPGWSGLCRRTIGSLGKRWLAVCDVPDHMLLPGRTGARHVRVRAGMELGPIHLGLWLLSWLVRWRVMTSLLPLAPLLQRIAVVLRPFGTDTGGMTVELTGTGQDGRPLRRRWTLEARQGDGPMIPAAPSAALALAMLRGETPAAGARPGLNEIDRDAILAVLSPFAIPTHTADEHPLPLYRHAMAAAFDTMPEPIRAMHDRVTSYAASGRSSVAVAKNPVARLLSFLGVLPKSGQEVATTVTFTLQDGRERWHRRFGEFASSSVLGWPEDGVIWERFGPLAGRAELVAREDGLDMVITGFRLLGLTLPRFLWLKAWGKERVDDAGRFFFDVGIGLPFGIGLVTDRGWLSID